MEDQFEPDDEVMTAVYNAAKELIEKGEWEVDAETEEADMLREAGIMPGTPAPIALLNHHMVQLGYVLLNTPHRSRWLKKLPLTVQAKETTK